MQVYPQQTSHSHQPQYDYTTPTNDGPSVISSINMSNLSADEQNKLKNISNLQNAIQISQSQINTFQQKDTRGETNLRREKEQLTEREKVEIEMKKWKKEQQKVLMFLLKI